MKLQKNRKYAFFDVCGTLTKNNNTEDFVRLATNTTKLKNRELLIGQLNGLSDKELMKTARTYIEYLKENELFSREILKKLRDYKDNGFCVHLLSASIHYPIKAIAEYLGVEWSASKAEVVEGKCSGKLEYDLLDCKYVALDKIKNVDYKKSVFYTDNPGDKIIFDRFQKENIFFIDNRLNEEIDCVNKDNFIFTYFPGCYYLISRLHFGGFVGNFLLREIVPFAVVAIVNGFDLWKLLLNFWIFYSVYEIGSLWNDSHYGDEDKPTKRIAPGIRINFGLFLTIRLFLVLLGFYFRILPMELVFLLPVCLIIFFIHTLIERRYRTATLFLLRGFKTFVPIFFWLSETIIWEIGVVTFVVYQLPSIVYYHFFRSSSVPRRKLVMIEVFIGVLSVLVTFCLDRRLVFLVLYLMVIRAVEILHMIKSPRYATFRKNSKRISSKIDRAER